MQNYTTVDIKSGACYCIRPGGTSPVGAAMAGPTFEFGQSLFLITKTVKFLKPKCIL